MSAPHPKNAFMPCWIARVSHVSESSLHSMSSNILILLTGSSSKSQGCQAVFCIDYIPKEVRKKLV